MPKPGFVKRQCPRCRYRFASPADSTELRCADCTSLGAGRARTRAAAERVDQIVGEYEATALRLGETLVGELFNTVARRLKVPPRRSRRREARTYATNRSLTRVYPGTAVYSSRSLTPSAASTASSVKKLPVQAALSRVRTA